MGRHCLAQMKRIYKNVNADKKDFCPPSPHILEICYQVFKKKHTRKNTFKTALYCIHVFYLKQPYFSKYTSHLCAFIWNQTHDFCTAPPVELSRNLDSYYVSSERNVIFHWSVLIYITAQTHTVTRYIQ